MWISQGGDVYTFTFHPPLLFLASVLSLCFLSLYMLSAHMYTQEHTCQAHSHGYTHMHTPTHMHEYTHTYMHIYTRRHTQTRGSNMLISSFLTPKNKKSDRTLPPTEFLTAPLSFFLSLQILHRSRFHVNIWEKRPVKTEQHAKSLGDQSWTATLFPAR